MTAESVFAACRESIRTIQDRCGLAHDACVRGDAFVLEQPASHRIVRLVLLARRASVQLPGASLASGELPDDALAALVLLWRQARYRGGAEYNRPRGGYKVSGRASGAHLQAGVC